MNSEENNCIFCFEENNNILIKYEHKCGKYKIHQICLDKWFLEHSHSCFICRNNILSDAESESDSESNSELNSESQNNRNIILSEVDSESQNSSNPHLELEHSHNRIHSHNRVHSQNYIEENIYINNCKKIYTIILCGICVLSGCTIFTFYLNSVNR